MVAELRSLIELYLSQKPTRNPSRLAAKSGVSYATLRRILQNEVSTVSLETTVSILRVITTLSESLNFIEKHYPSSGQTIKEFSSKLASSNFAPLGFVSLLDDYDVWFTSILAERTKGVSIEELNRHIGENNAKKSIDKLEKAGFFEVKAGRFYLVEPDYNLGSSAQATLSVIRHLTKTFDEEKRTKDGHMLSYLVKGWSDEGLKLIRERLKAVAIELSEASNNPKYQGDKLAFAGVIAGTIEE
jgi:transcriptional regulator with XRE-family HTH domain